MRVSNDRIVRIGINQNFSWKITLFKNCYKTNLIFVTLNSMFNAVLVGQRHKDVIQSLGEWKVCFRW